MQSLHRHNEKGENTLANDKIIIKGAREHNLKNVNLTLPREKLIVMTGLSGSGKSSLAFDTIYADGQRRYVESLSSYARMFLGRMDKPAVDEITGLSPAISIDQKTTSHNPRSTVGTVTEIYTLSLHDALPISGDLVHVRLIHPTQKHPGVAGKAFHIAALAVGVDGDRKSTRLNSSHRT